MPTKHILEEPASDTILVRGLAAGTTEEGLRGAFGKYGRIAQVLTKPGHDSAAVKFSNPAPVDAVLEEEEAFEIDGQRVEVRRVLSEAPGAAALDADAALPLDTVIVHGACTRTAIGVAALAAQARATTFAFWDRRHKASDEPALNGKLRKAVYAASEEDTSDLHVMNRASDTFGVGRPKCALVHTVSDQVASQGDFQNPLRSPNELIKAQALNYLETASAHNTVGAYAQWIHSFRAACYVVLPHAPGGEGDVCGACVQARRIVTADPLRIPDGSGWTIGLQLLGKDATANSRMVYSTIKKCAKDDAAKHAASGRVVRMETSGVRLVAE